MTENLSTAYDAIALLESLGLPVSQEQLLQPKIRRYFFECLI